MVDPDRHLSSSISDLHLLSDLFNSFVKYTQECVTNHNSFCRAKKRFVNQGSTIEPNFRLPKRVSEAYRESANFSDLTSSRFDIDTVASSRPTRKAAVKARSGFTTAFISNQTKLRRPTNFDSKLGGITLLSPIPQSSETVDSPHTFVVPSTSSDPSNRLDVDEVFKKPTAPSTKTNRKRKTEEEEVLDTERETDDDSCLPIKNETNHRPSRARTNRQKKTFQAELMDVENVDDDKGTSNKSIRLKNNDGAELVDIQNVSSDVSCLPNRGEAQRSRTKTIRKIKRSEVESIGTQNKAGEVLCSPNHDEAQRSRSKTIHMGKTSDSMDDQNDDGGDLGLPKPDEPQRSRTKTIRKKKQSKIELNPQNDVLCVPKQNETVHEHKKTVRKTSSRSDDENVNPNAIVRNGETTIVVTKSEPVRTSKRLSSGEGDISEPQAKRFAKAKDPMVNSTPSLVPYSAPKTRSKAKMTTSKKRSRSADASVNLEPNKNTPVVPNNSLLALVGSFKKPNLPFTSPSIGGINSVKHSQAVQRIVTPKDPLKMKLSEAKKKEEDALKKKTELILQKKQEIRLNREMKVKKVAESRAAVEKEKMLQAEREKKEKEEKEKQLKAEMLKQKEENQMRKKQLNHQKAMEAEERRQREEATRKARLKELEEEQRKAEEAKRKQLEEAERLANHRRAQEKEEELARLQKAKEKEKAQQMQAKSDNSSVEQLDIEVIEGLDEEEGSKLPVPSWGQNPLLASALEEQSSVKVDLIRDFFGRMPLTPDLDAIFGNNVMRRPRTSSAVWLTPPTAVQKRSSRAPQRSSPR